MNKGKYERIKKVMNMEGSFREFAIEKEYGKLYLQSVIVKHDMGIGLVYVPQDVDILKDWTVSTTLLRIKYDLIDMGYPMEESFIIFQGERTFVYGVDAWQRFSCEVEDPAQYVLNLFLSKEDDWVIKMAKASEIEKKYDGFVPMKGKVLTTEEADEILKSFEVV